MRLIVEQGSMAGQIVPLQGGAIVVGRGEGSDLRLAETGMSRQHARFQSEPQGWAVVDLGSTNGTFVNGQRLSANQPYLLRPGDRITMGSAVLVVQPGEPRGAAPVEMPQPEQPNRRRQPALLVAGAVALIVVLVGIVILLVTLLQPEPEPGTPTVAGPLDQIVTAFPVPTGLQGVMTSVATLLPTGFPLLPSVPTPTPESALPGRGMAKGPAPSPPPVPPPEPPIQFAQGAAVP